MSKFIFIAVVSFIIVVLTKIAAGLKKNTVVKSRPKMPSRGFTLFYSDEKNEDRLSDVIYSKILYSDRYEIQGKPDFIFKKNNNGDLFPVELKSGAIGDRAMPYEGDLMQLCAYFLIIEDVFEVRPEAGSIIYRDYMFTVKNTAAMRRRVLSVLSDMREMLQTGEQEPNSSFAACRYCICKGTVCEYCEE